MAQITWVIPASAIAAAVYHINAPLAATLAEILATLLV